MSAAYLTRHGTNARTGRPMARFYSVSVAPTLFGECSVIREWGRIGSCGTVRVKAYANSEVALLALEAAVHAKVRRGYKKLY